MVPDMESEFASLAGRMITLKEWALRHGIDPATARQKALRGGFKTAVKIGRDWMIDEDEPRRDLRKKDE
jgi:predicted site-specific integrase-resolvase